MDFLPLTELLQILDTITMLEKPGNGTVTVTKLDQSAIVFI